MITSRYLERFQKLQSSTNLKKGADYRLYGEKILIEVIQPPEEVDGMRKTKGGIFIGESSHIRSEYLMLKGTMAVVLMVGEGYYDKDADKDVPLDVEPGDIILVSEAGLRYFTTLPGIEEYTEKSVAMTVESEIHMVFKGAEAYEKYREALKA